MTTIITTRAGKDLVSSLVAGLLTIGTRFGGALDGAATEFTRAFDTGLTPREFVDSMRRANKLIPGIGHKIKSKTNPDFRVELVKDFVKKNFPSTEVSAPVHHVPRPHVVLMFCGLCRCSTMLSQWKT